MPKYINADEIKRKVNKEIEDAEEEMRNETLFAIIQGATRVLYLIDKMPAADVIEIVRCKDCKYFESDIENSKFGVCCKLVINNCGMEFCETDYCSRGERRENNDKG